MGKRRFADSDVSGWFEAYALSTKLGDMHVADFERWLDENVEGDYTMVCWYPLENGTSRMRLLFENSTSAMACRMHWS